ncbi:hypothetical protein LUZ60_009572 [Juncus effusus]|nr:hypothetical protein LUZ60_009572 [Juncus effusus]
MEGSNQGIREVFHGCRSEDIGTLTNVDMQMDDIFIQQSFLGELLTPTTTSSSSSLCSLSVGSPEFSYPPLVQNIHFKTPTYDHHDEVMTRAILAVLSSDPSPPSLPYGYQNTQNCQITEYEKLKNGQKIGRQVGAFREYNEALNPRISGFKPAACGQKMIKSSVSILKGMHGMRLARQETEEARAPSSNQLHHMISERKRREKLNESFEALRMLLPPGSKKDKASVLVKTKEYVNALKAQITELEAKNETLEAKLHQTEEPNQICRSNEKFEIKLSAESSSRSETLEIKLTVVIKVDCDMTDLTLRVLNCIKNAGDFSLASMVSSVTEPEMFTKSTLAIHAKVNDWCEESFKEALSMTVNDALGK